jgi:hypothetical protein
VTVGHAGTGDERRDDTNISAQRGRNFDSDEVFGMVEAAPVRVRGREPVLTDYRDQDIAGADGVLEDFDEVDSWFNAVDVHEDAVFTELFDEVVVEAAGVCGTVLAPVTDENPRHRMTSNRRFPRGQVRAADSGSGSQEEWDVPR